MPSRLQKFRRLSRTSREDDKHLSHSNAAPPDQTSKTKLAPASNGAVNPIPSSTPIYNSRNTQTISSTIRTVPSFESSSNISRSPSPYNSRHSSSVNSSASGASYTSHQPQISTPSPPSRLKPKTSHSSLAVPHGVGSQMSLSDATPRGKENGADHSLSLQVPEANDEGRYVRETSPQWDGTVGKAALGKTGRVINKLVSDNESLKRELKIEQLKSEESKQAAKMVEEKMERMVQEYEDRLFQANLTKTLLNRKERQVENLESAVELEKKRTADAQERERTWRQEMEGMRRDTKVQVEEAVTQAAHMESRYNTISSHWKDQGAEVERAVTSMKGKIHSLVDERAKDDEKINVLRDLCDQQDVNIRDLQRQKDEMSRQFEEYKRSQEDALKTIKENARLREEEQARTIEETKEVLHKLKWALQVKQNVKGAQ
ncbi:hypothetical protein F5Y16DRAFT_369546 [Xylariaceae sp. FL0255]|nr:hypothetical protein F5Y16DRAFT_369546 [Xylariaceae sp. FL0255]